MTEREDDRRISALESSIALVVAQQQSLTGAVGKVEGKIDSLDSKFDKMFEQLLKEHGDPKLTSAGQQLLEKIGANGQAVLKVSERVDDLEDFRDQLRGAMGVLKVAVSLSSIVSAAAIVITLLHQVHL